MNTSLLPSYCQRPLRQHGNDKQHCLATDSVVVALGQHKNQLENLGGICKENKKVPLRGWNIYHHCHCIGISQSDNIGGEFIRRMTTLPTPSQHLHMPTIHQPHIVIFPPPPHRIILSANKQVGNEERRTKHHRENNKLPRVEMQKGWAGLAASAQPQMSVILCMWERSLLASSMDVASRLGTATLLVKTPRFECQLLLSINWHRTISHAPRQPKNASMLGSSWATMEQYGSQLCRRGFICTPMPSTNSSMYPNLHWLATNNGRK